LRLRAVDAVDAMTGNRKRPNPPTAYTVAGFECGSMAFISARSGDPRNWVVHLSPLGTRLELLPISFSDPEEALRFLQRWADAQSLLARARAPLHARYTG
jgi:hypothetical protein